MGVTGLTRGKGGRGMEGRQLMMDDSGGEYSGGVRSELLPLNGGRELHHLGFPWRLGVRLC